MRSKYELNKPHIYKWRASHPNYNAACCKRYVASHREEINTYQRQYRGDHLDKCREQNRRCQKKTYYFKKEAQKFRNILIDTQ